LLLDSFKYSSVRNFDWAIWRPGFSCLWGISFAADRGQRGEAAGAVADPWVAIEYRDRPHAKKLSEGNLAGMPIHSSVVRRAMGVQMSAELKSRFRAGAKVCTGVIMVLLVIAALGPAKWAPRTDLGWQFDHFIGYFGITLFVCLAWPRPFLVGGVIMVVAAALEGLQALTPDRSANLEAALCGAGGALAAAFIADLSIRVWGLLIKGAKAAKMIESP
jgi:VanZ family protein